jgi:hypothetical protein
LSKNTALRSNWKKAAKKKSQFNTASGWKGADFQDENRWDGLLAEV